MVGNAGFLVANYMTLGSGNGVAVFLIAGTILDVEKEALGVVFHIDSPVVRRRSKGTVDGVEANVGRTAWGIGFRAGRFREDGGAGVRFDSLFHKFFARQEDGKGGKFLLCIEGCARDVDKCRH